ncbi:MAG: protein rep [Planctomycetota bacterium]
MQKELPKLATQVQNIEISGRQRFSTDYRTQCAGSKQNELEASLELYEYVSEVTGKSHVDDYVNCRRRAWFSVNLVDRRVRVVANSCRKRWCPLCSEALTRYRTHSVSDWLENQGTSRFLTLTLKHSDHSLKDQVDDLYYYFNRLRDIKYFKQVCTGGVWFFQVKRSERTGEWHPHLHCLITGSYIVHPRLSAIWERITGGSTVVDIRTIRDEKTAAKYVARYSSRPAILNDFSTEDRYAIFWAMHNRRLCGRWGTGRTCSLTPDRHIDLSSWVKLGTWTSIVKHAPFHSYSEVVLRCWKQNLPLPAFINLHCLEATEHTFTSADLLDLGVLEAYEGGYP